MKKVYNSLKDIKYTIDYRSAEIYMKYAILYNIYGIEHKLYMNAKKLHDKLPKYR